MERKRKYLLLTTDFPPGVGGVQKLLAGLCEGLSKKAEVSVVTLGDGRSEINAAPGIDVTYVPVYRLKPITHARLALAGLLKTPGKDLIICGHVNAGIPALLAHFFLRKPYIVYVHAMEITDRRRRFLYELILKRAKRIIAGSSYSKSLVAWLFGIRSSDIVHPSVDHTLLRSSRPDSRRLEKAIRQRPKIILTVGRLDAGEKYKGHDTVIEALPIIRESVPEAEYWIVGDGSDRPRLEALAEKTGVVGAVKFFGQVCDVARFYRECDVFVMAADVVDDGRIIKGEGFGLVYVEAALFGKPVVAGDRGGAVDAVIDGYTGFLVPPGNPEILAERVVYLLKNPHTAAVMGRRGKLRALTYFTRQRQLKEFENILAESIS
jgi:phosphatidylinositol alpha-1,6-mannosyltransferase